MSRKINELDRVRVIRGPNKGVEFGVRKIDRFRTRKGLYLWGQVGNANIIIPYRNCELVKQHRRNKLKERQRKRERK